MKISDILTEVNPNTLKGSFAVELDRCRKFLLDNIKKFRTEFTAIYILGSWYGNMSLKISADPSITADKIINVDMDKKCLRGGKQMADELGYTNIEPMLKDANTLDYRQLGKQGLVINQSTTNIKGDDWFNNIPKGTMVAFTARNNDPGAVEQFNGVEDLENKYPLDKILFKDTITEKDPETEYDCYFLIGIK